MNCSAGLLLLQLASGAALAPAPSPLQMRRRAPPPRRSPRASARDDVDELLGLLKRGDRRPADKTAEERTRIRELMEALERVGAREKYLESKEYVGAGRGGMLLWDNYELAYFDRSIDGGRGSERKGDDPYKNATRPFGLRSKILGALFGLRFSFQHLVAPDVAVNYVGFSCCGLPGAVITRGVYKRLRQAEIDEIRKESGTRLRTDTAVRIDFERPVLSFGPRWAPVTFAFDAGQSPPVSLCTTYVDDRLRLALAARGGRLAFTRGGLASESFANDWEGLLKQRPFGGVRVLAAIALLVMSAPILLVGALFPQARIRRCAHLLAMIDP